MRIPNLTGNAFTQLGEHHGFYGREHFHQTSPEENQLPLVVSLSVNVRTIFERREMSRNMNQRSRRTTLLYHGTVGNDVVAFLGSSCAIRGTTLFHSVSKRTWIDGCLTSAVSAINPVSRKDMTKGS